MVFRSGSFGGGGAAPLGSRPPKKLPSKKTYSDLENERQQTICHLSIILSMHCDNTMIELR